jgi:SHS2 domain-containing protein
MTDDVDRGYELIEHTADVGLHVWAPTLDELFAEAAVALVSVMGEGSGPPTKREEFSIEAPDLEGLFVDWLSEVLFRFEAREIVPSVVRVHVEDDKRLSATIEGPSTEGFVEQGPAVKAVTYHGLEVGQTSGTFEARVYLDV